jgi:hypothetical protein
MAYQITAAATRLHVMQVVSDRIDGSCDCQRSTFIEGRTIHEVRHHAVGILLMSMCLTRH